MIVLIVNNQVTEEILHQIRRNISNTLSKLLSGPVPECGDGIWYRIAYLNTTDPSQQCPSACHGGSKTLVE